MLQNEPLAEIGLITAENGTSRVWATNQPQSDPLDQKSVYVWITEYHAWKSWGRVSRSRSRKSVQFRPWKCSLGRVFHDGSLHLIENILSVTGRALQISRGLRLARTSKGEHQVEIIPLQINARSAEEIGHSSLSQPRPPLYYEWMKSSAWLFIAVESLFIFFALRVFTGIRMSLYLLSQFSRWCFETIQKDGIFRMVSISSAWEMENG